MAILEAARAEAASQGGRIVFVEGEAGVGKTSLIQGFRQSLPRGTTTALGASDPLSTPQPLGPIIEIASDLDPEVARLIDRGRPPIEVMRGFLAALRSPKGRVVLLDDLHWADEATLDALRLTAGRLGGVRCLIVVTYRNDQLGRWHPLRVLMGELAASNRILRMSLAPLSIDAVRALAAPYGGNADALYERTGGNPFFVSGLLTGGNGTLPESVVERVVDGVGQDAIG